MRVLIASNGLVMVVPSPAAATPDMKLIPAEVLVDNFVDAPDDASIWVASFESFRFDCS